MTASLPAAVMVIDLSIVFPMVPNWPESSTVRIPPDVVLAIAVGRNRQGAVIRHSLLSLPDRETKVVE
jgi:hypothetical protein